MESTSERRCHEIWREQCEAGEAIRVRYGVESAFDYVVGEKLLNFAEAAASHPEFAQALPQFVSRVRGMFAPEDMVMHLKRTEIHRRTMDEPALDDDDPDFEAAKAAERARQFELVKELLTAPTLGTS